MGFGVLPRFTVVRSTLPRDFATADRKVGLFFFGFDRLIPTGLGHLGGEAHENSIRDVLDVEIRL